VVIRSPKKCSTLWIGKIKTSLIQLLKISFTFTQSKVMPSLQLESQHQGWYLYQRNGQANSHKWPQTQFKT